MEPILKDTHSIDHRPHRVSCVTPGLWLYLFGDEGLVYSEIHNRFAGLDAAGVSAYRAFDAGACIEDLRTFRDSPEDGLDAVYALSQGVFPKEDSSVEWPALDHLRTANIDIHGIPVLLECPSGALEYLCRDYFQNCPSTRQTARYHLYAQQLEDGWIIYGNGRELLSQLRDEQLGLGFLHAARSLLYAEAKYDVAFHAAMVAEGDRGIMLSAPRESGKSTLAAYLVSRGFDLLNDEPALLHLDACSVSSFGLPISLKEGSWAVLQNDWPQLANAPIHVRSDGTKIRLLHPAQGRSSSRPRPLTHILFPEYSTSATVSAERLSPLITLSLLNEGGMLLARHITRASFEAFLQLICSIPAYRIRFASLKEADQLIRDL